MFAPVKDIVTDLLRYDLPPYEPMLILCLTRTDVRFLSSEWKLSEEDITTLMQRLNVTYQQGADVSMIRQIAKEIMDEKHANRSVNVSAVALQKIMLLAGSEMNRLAGEPETFLTEEKEAMRYLQTVLKA